MAAFTITGTGYVTIEGLTLETAAAYPPETIFLLGRIKGNAGANKILNSTVLGYASKTLVFSQASENNIWQNDTFRMMGGGAQYGFYTSSKDDLGICPDCKVASNLSLYFQQFIFTVNSGQTAFAAIGDQIGGGTGDHYYQRGYIGLEKDAGNIGFEFISGAKNQGGPNNTIDVTDVRIENGGYGFYFKKNQEATIYSVNIEGVTWASAVVVDTPKVPPADGRSQTYFAYGEDGLTLSQFTMSRNLARQHGVTGPSSFDSLTNSKLDEASGPISIRSKASGNILMIRLPGSLSVPDTQRPLNTFVSGNAQAKK